MDVVNAEVLSYQEIYEGAIRVCNLKKKNYEKYTIGCIRKVIQNIIFMDFVMFVAFVSFLSVKFVVISFLILIK